MANKRQEYQTEFNRENYRSFIIRFSKKRKTNLIKFIESQPNFNKYINDLVENDFWKKKTGGKLK